MNLASLTSFDVAAGYPFDDNGYPTVYIPTVRITTDGGDEIRIVLSGRTWRGEELTSLEVLIPAVVP